MSRQLYHFLTCDSGLVVPTLPTSKTLRKWVNKEMQDLNLKFDNIGASMGFAAVTSRCVKKVLGTSALGMGRPPINIQIMGDGVRVYRQTLVTTIAVRVLSNDNEYNSMTSMQLM